MNEGGNMKRLYRSQKNKVLAGICGGLGEYYNVDPVLVRIIAVFLTLFLCFPFLVYLVAIFVIPQEPQGGFQMTGQPSDVQQAQAHAQTQTPGPSVKQGIPMDEHIKILGILYIAFSALGLIAALIVFVAITGGGLISGNDAAITITTIVGTAIAAVLVLFSAPGIIGGMGLLKRQSWARVLVLVLGIINLINIPFGTALGIYTIWVLTNKETEAFFAPQV
jgi:phage shock protein PspC (stress-responsive transcriptional regulator)